MMLKKIEIGGSGPKLQLVHANAYTPECYFQFAQYFEDSYHVHFLRQRPLWANQSPGQLRHWELFADDLIDMMEEHGDTQVIGLGHSLGAVATCMASIKRPDLFKQVVLIDPVFINRGRIDPLRLMPIVLRDRLFPLIKIAANRRNMWADRTEAREHLGSKKVFQRFDPKVFDDFLNYALVDCADGVTLAYPRSWEARVYETAPYVWSLIKKNIRSYLNH